MDPNSSSMQRLHTVTLAFLFVAAPIVKSQDLPPEPDPRMKSDVLLIIAHPDDETALGSLLAKIVLDDGKKVAVIYCTRGTGGGNSVGREQGAAMGMIREIEGRRALATLGISTVWVLNGEDTPGQDVFRSLQNWGHGKILEDVVRLVRLTRAEVIMTWLPAFVAGENHGDHQAAGVIATEAFHLAGNPTAFPSQIVAPRERTDINNITEGMEPWQPKKLYYFSDANHAVDIPGPAFDMRGISRSRGVPYYKLATELHKTHRTQGDVAEIALEAERTGDYEPFLQWLRLYRPLFGKSLVPCDPRGEIFEGINSSRKNLSTRPSGNELKSSEVLRLGGPFEFYRNFWKTYDIEHIGKAFEPELEISAGSYVHVPLILQNHSTDSLQVLLTVGIPVGWKEASGSGKYHLGPEHSVPVQMFLIASGDVRENAEEISIVAATAGKVIGTTKIRVTVREWTLPQ